MDTLERMPWAAQNAVFKKLAEIGDLRKLSKEDRIKYDRDIRNYRDWYSTIDTARNEGKAEGIAQGKAEGKAEGRAEEKREMALNFKALGFPLEAISKASGLSIEEIEKL